MTEQFIVIYMIQIYAPPTLYVNSFNVLLVYNDLNSSFYFIF